MAQLADPALYGEAQKDALKALILDQAYIARELAELVAEWLALQGQLELAGDEVIEGSLLGSESGQSFTELLEIRAWPLFLFFPSPTIIRRDSTSPTTGEGHEATEHHPNGDIGHEPDCLRDRTAVTGAFY